MDGWSCSKRAKAPVGNAGASGGGSSSSSHCLVDGCSADLSLCRDYHRRHKVCQVHSKTPKVAIGGREQRFCQQCSRFHSLVEFDEGKRSCRKRLDGHNRRRRKPQPEPPGARTGPRILSFAGCAVPQILPSTVVVSSPPWPEKPEDQSMMMYGSPGSSERVLSFPSPRDYHDDHRAPSLLSSGPTARELGLTGGSLGQLSYFGQEQSAGNKAAAVSSGGAELAPSNWSAFNLGGGEGSSSASGPHPTLTFMWE